DHAEASQRRVGRLLSADYLVIPSIKPDYRETVQDASRLDASGNCVAYKDTTRIGKIHLSIDLIQGGSGSRQPWMIDKGPGGFTPGDTPLADQFNRSIRDATKEAAAWLAHAFPIRAMVVQVQGNPGKLEVILNVGVAAGVQPGQRYKVQ